MRPVKNLVINGSLSSAAVHCCYCLVAANQDDLPADSRLLHQLVGAGRFSQRNALPDDRLDFALCQQLEQRRQGLTVPGVLFGRQARRAAVQSAFLPSGMSLNRMSRAKLDSTTIIPP